MADQLPFRAVRERRADTIAGFRWMYGLGDGGRGDGDGDGGRGDEDGGRGGLSGEGEKMRKGERVVFASCTRRRMPSFQTQTHNRYRIRSSEHRTADRFDLDPSPR